MGAVIVFDFDNCIALNAQTGEGSEEIKDRAWFRVFPEPDYDSYDLGCIIEKTKLKIAGGRGDRNDIVAAILEYYGFSEDRILEEIIRRCEQFDEVVQEGILELGVSLEVRGALEALSKRATLYINTATPRAPMVKTLEALGLRGFFKGVYGRPGTKVSNLQRIATVEDVPFDQILFVGDMPGDYMAGKAVGCRFIGVRTKRNNAWYVEQPFPVIGSVAELEPLLWGRGR